MSTTNGTVEQEMVPGPDRSRRLRRKWTWATAGGWIAGIVVAAIPVFFVYFGVARLVCETMFYTLPDSLSLTVWLAVAGALAGVAQWLVSRRQVPQAGRWLRVSPLAWGTAGGWLGFTSVFLLWMESSISDPSFRLVLDLTAACLVGIASVAIVGVTQWVALMGRPAGMKHWVLSSTWGWGSSLALTVFGFYFAVNWEPRELDVVSFRAILSIMLCGVLCALLTGVVTASQLSSPPQLPAGRPVSLRQLALLLAVLWAVSLVLAVVIGLGMPSHCPVLNFGN